jgi:hypothetical protein
MTLVTALFSIGVTMAILDAVTTAPAKMGIKIVISGVEGVGKTTLACNAPRPLLIPLEAGYSGLVVHKVPQLEYFEHVMMLLDEIIEKVKTGQFIYQTLVFDSITALERLIHQAVLQTDPTYVKGANKKAVTMESALGGYGKAYTFANEKFEEFLAKCEQLTQHGGINIVFTAHVFAAKIVDPLSGEYDSWDLLLHSPKNQKTYGKREMLTQWADIIGFLHEPMYVSEGKNMNKGMSANQGRVLALTRTPSYIAKNRFGVTALVTLPKEKGWNFLAQEIYQSSGNMVDLYNRD